MLLAKSSFIYCKMDDVIFSEFELLLMPPLRHCSHILPSRCLSSPARNSLFSNSPSMLKSDPRYGYIFFDNLYYTLWTLFILKSIKLEGFSSDFLEVGILTVQTSSFPLSCLHITHDALACDWLLNLVFRLLSLKIMRFV